MKFQWLWHGRYDVQRQARAWYIHETERRPAFLERREQGGGGASHRIWEVLEDVWTVSHVLEQMKGSK